MSVFQLSHRMDIGRFNKLLFLSNHLKKCLCENVCVLCVCVSVDARVLPLSIVTIVKFMKLHNSMLS